MQICIFEDDKIEQFKPLTLSRPVYDLVCGINTLREKIERHFPGKKISLHCRKYLVESVKEQNPKTELNKITDDECLFINGRILFNKDLSKLLRTKKSENKLFLSGNNIVAVKLSGKKLLSFKKNLPEIFHKNYFKHIPFDQIDVKLTEYIWDLIKKNEVELINDCNYFTKKFRSSFIKTLPAEVHCVNRKDIFIKKEVKIKPGVVLDASKGPICIDKNVFIHPNAVIEGPVYVGESSIIKSAAVLYDNVSIGRNCKVGGEVENTIMLPYSNKQHAGFMGHSYLGSWINLGANTNCSDLKNNYGNIKVKVNGKLINTDTKFLGAIIGDHTKTAINTMLNTATVIGFSCNIYGAGFPEKFIPSYTWGGCEFSEEYKLSKAEETASIVYGRRNKTFNSIDKKLFKKIFNLTIKERKEYF
ncbi:MAG: hypothetical protein IIB07_09530 [Bacteroidetes bacterium]|nr:hypothetical protein [Bacteroidota bacterium]